MFHRPAKLTYACRALIELSLHWPSKDPLQIQTIAVQQKIPMKFLTQILITLKQIGYTKSIRGKNGGYLLARDPAKMTLGDLITHMGGLQDPGSFESDQSSSSTDVVLGEIWNTMERTVFDSLSEITFEQIALKVRTRKSTWNFEI